MLLTKFRLILVTDPVILIIIQRVTTTASHGTREATASHGRTETTKIGRIRIISRGQNKDKKPWQNNNKSKMINLVILALLCHRIKKFFVPADCDENTFQIICTLVKAQIDKAKQSGGNTKQINEISKDTLVNLLNISDETYDARTVSSPASGKRPKFHLPSSSTD